VRPTEAGASSRAIRTAATSSRLTAPRPSYAGLLGRGGEQRGRGAVDGVLPRGAAARSGARREHSRVRTFQGRRHVADLRLLQIEYDGPPAGRLDIRHVIGVANKPDGFVTATGELPGQSEGDLAMSTGDHDAHAAEPKPWPVLVPG
jgi:hypothetical protein